MEPIVLPMAELKPALVGLNRVIDKNSKIPALARIKIERTKDGWITLAGCDDFKHFVAVRLEQPVDGCLTSIIINYDDLLNVASRCSKEESILIESNERASEATVMLKYPVGGKMSGYRCERFSAEDFPLIPETKGESISIDNHLRSAFHEAMDCASTDEHRPILNGIYVDVTDPKCQNVVGTNGRHLYASNSFSLPLKDSILIPKHKFLEWKGFNADGDWRLSAGSAPKDTSEQVLEISSRRWRFISSQMEGSYPNWRHVLPTDFRTTIHLPGKVLDSAVEIIERMQCDPKDANDPIGLKIERNRLVIQGREAPGEKWTEIELPGARITGNPITILLNREFVLKALRFGLDRIEIQDETSAMRFINGGRQLVVLPLKPEEKTPNQPGEEVYGKGSPEPVTTTFSATSTGRKKMMGGTSKKEEPNSRDSKQALEAAVDQVESLKEMIRSTLASVNVILSSLKTAQREQKVTEREFRSIKGTLRSLQSVQI